MRTALIITCLLVITAIGACQLLLPERFAVNAPVASLLFGRKAAAPSEEQIHGRLRVPVGFSLSLYAEDLSNVRWMKPTPTGDLIVSQPREGRVVLLERDRDGDGRSDASHPLLTDLNRPHGLELADGWLYVAETDAILRVRFDAEKRALVGEPERFITDLPADGNHWTRTVAIGPDGDLYVSVGSSCNVCSEEDDRRAAILRYRIDGSEPRVHATGLRNAVGFDWQPETGDLYATDNGRDLLGNDFPPCELDRIVEGGFYGWPIANGDRVPDPDFGAGQQDRIRASIPPAHEFRAHNAPLGISFVRGDWLPESHRGAALVALHGSWNRTTKDGYKVVSLHWDEHGRIEERDFMWGFLENEQVIGRPVHVVEGLDDELFVSDDYSGAIWRVGRAGSGRAAAKTRSAREPVDPFAGLSGETRMRLVAEGRRLYAQHDCASCHDPARATSENAVKELTGLSQRYTLDQLTVLFATPPSPMPIVDIAEPGRRALAAFVLDTHP